MGLIFISLHSLIQPFREPNKTSIVLICEHICISYNIIYPKKIHQTGYLRVQYFCLKRQWQVHIYYLLVTKKQRFKMQDKDSSLSNRLQLQSSPSCHLKINKQNKRYNLSYNKNVMKNYVRYIWFWYYCQHMIYQINKVTLELEQSNAY